MEETLGKRISANRKRLGITQDRLAEQLGVTAQAVSKWENDQSCPDITMLPKLAEIFSISVDTLLGVVPQEPEKIPVIEVIDRDPQADEGPKNNWEFRWNAGRKGSLAFAVWVLLMGSLMLFNLVAKRPIGIWDLAWPSALLIFGLTGLYPRFSFFSLGCTLFGGYSLLENMELTCFGLSSQLLLTIAVILLGLRLLVDALGKSRRSSFTIINNKKVEKKKTDNCTLDEDSFECSTMFCESSYRIDLPLLRRGEVDVAFGELTLDLTGCQDFAYGCYMDADCAFGDLTILVPKRVRAEVDSDSAFGSVDVRGDYSQDATETIRIDADVSFGQITIRYI